MAKPAKKTIGQLQIIEATVNDIDFRRRITHGLVQTHQELFGRGRPTEMEGYVGQNVYMEGTKNIGKHLADYGFVRKCEDSQHHLLSENHFECPVRLTIHSGQGGDGFVEFNWSKGPRYRKSVWENSLNYRPLQPRLFDKPRSGIKKLSKLNLGVVHSISSRWVKAWIFVGNKWTRKFTILDCPVIALICNQMFEDDSIPDLAYVDDTSDYSLRFGERATGT